MSVQPLNTLTDTWDDFVPSARKASGEPRKMVAITSSTHKRLSKLADENDLSLQDMVTTVVALAEAFDKGLA